MPEVVIPAQSFPVEIKDSNDADPVGDVSATPASNTILDRLKQIQDDIAGIETDIASLEGKDFATQTTLATLLTETEFEARVGEVSATPTTNTVLDRLKQIQDDVDALLTAFNAEDFASETTLTAANANLADIETILTTIRDTAGIKKITDQLPAGTNEIGKVAQGTKGAGSNAWPQVLYDASGNAVGVILDGALYRIQTDSKVGKGASDLVHLDAIDTAAGKGRLKTTIYSADGDPVAFGTAPPNPSSIKNDFVVNATYGNDLLQDGDPTPVIFTYDADPTYDISIQEIVFVMVSNSITFGSNYFGAASGPLTNGLKVEITANGNTGTVELIKQNEDFKFFASPGGFDWVVSSKDLMSANYVIGGGLKLVGGSSDNIKVTVQDDIDSAAVYFKCFVKGNLLDM
jgi:hypothetical protein